MTTHEIRNQSPNYISDEQWIEGKALENAWEKLNLTVEDMIPDVELTLSDDLMRDTIQIPVEQLNF